MNCDIYSHIVQALLWNLFMLFVVVASIVLIIVESWPSYQKKSDKIDSPFFITEAVIVGIFTFEYVARIIVTPKKILRFIFCKHFPCLLIQIIYFFFSLEKCQ